MLPLKPGGTSKPGGSGPLAGYVVAGLHDSQGRLGGGSGTSGRSGREVNG